MFALVLMNTSCCKPDDETPLPYVLQYPDWQNLTWVSTDGNSLVTTYPKLNITIDGNNQIKVVQPYSSTGTYSGTYTMMNVNGNNVSFTNSIDNAGDITGTFTKSGTQITLTTKGHTAVERIYILQIH